MGNTLTHLYIGRPTDDWRLKEKMKEEVEEMKKEINEWWNFRWQKAARDFAIVSSWVLYERAHFLMIDYYSSWSITLICTQFENFVTMRVYARGWKWSAATEEMETFKILLSMWNDLCLVNSVQFCEHCSHTHAHPQKFTTNEKWFAVNAKTRKTWQR